MSKEIRRLHRKPVQLTNFSSTTSADSSKNDSDKPQAPRQRRRRRHNGSSPSNSLPQPAEVDSTPTTQLPPSSLDDDVNSVRAELQEDFYHQQLSSADFSDESHDWDDPSFSSDYSHFLGLYE